MPGPGASLLQNLSTFLREPLFDRVRTGILAEVTKPKRPPDLADESVGSFISRRFGSAAADNIASALFHGIYAGDIYQLSARTILPAFWHMESRHSSIARGLLDQAFGGLRPISDEDLEILHSKSNDLTPARHLPLDIIESSLFTFRKGLGELPERLVNVLENTNNVTLHRNSSIRDLDLNSTQNGTEVRGTH